MCRVQCPKIKLKSNRRTGKAQVSLEMAITFITVFILLLGALNLFVWLNQRFILLQRDYEQGRVAAASSTSAQEQQVNESAYPKLDIVPNIEYNNAGTR